MQLYMKILQQACWMNKNTRCYGNIIQEEKEKLETGIREAQTRKRVVEKSIEEFLEIEKNLEKYLDERSFNQKMIDELVEKIYVSSKGMIEIQMKCSDVFQKITEILE